MHRYSRRDVHRSFRRYVRQPMRLFWLLFILSWVPVQVETNAQDTSTAPCGVVDALDYPIDGIIQGYDDFGLYRSRFGGNHTGLDIGFNRWGDPIHASARGRVTYADVEAWGTERGVVIIEHTFPDNSIYYTVYGHVEQSDTIFLPEVGTCVERGDVLAGIGYPSRGLPHLHYEIRDFMPDDGGPGYITGDPLAEGWYHPLDFTHLWRIRLSSFYIQHINLGHVPTLPPVNLESGMVALASGNILVGVSPTGQTWRVETDGVITGIAALPDDKVAAHTTTGQVVILQSGRYVSLWTVYGPEEPFVAVGDMLIFITETGGLAAYDFSGTRIWEQAGIGSDRVVHFAMSDNTLALGIQQENDTVNWRLIDLAGQILYETQFDTVPVFAPVPGDGWMALAESQLIHLTDKAEQLIAEVSPPGNRLSQITVDTAGNIALYLGDQDNTLLALDMNGDTRWRIPYPHDAGSLLPPVMETNQDCLLYTLDADGMLNVLNDADGSLLNQVQLYAGGTQSGNPRARLLEADSTTGQLRINSGFLTLMVLDGWILGGEVGAACQPVD